MFILFLILVAFVLLDSIGDATSQTNKKLSHLIQSLAVLSALLLVYFYRGDTLLDFGLFLLWYGVIRLALFDIPINLIYKENIDFIGSTGYWDIVIHKILVKLKIPNNFYFFLKMIIFIGFSIYMFYHKF